MALSEFDTDFEGLRVHVWEGGSGFPLLLLHGSGPGASTLGNWRLVLEPLAEHFHVIAADLVGFGLSQRKRQAPYFDMDLWLRQARSLSGRFQAPRIGVLGHSISGALALRLAMQEPRTVKVMTTGAMGASFEPNEHTERVWTFPRTREELRKVAECLVYDRSVITDEYIENRLKVLHAPGYAEYFEAMFSGPKQRFIDAAALTAGELQSIRADVLMVHGRDDLPFPAVPLTQALARSLPQADVCLLARCGHSPALEQPRKLLTLARMFFGAA